MKEKPKRVDIAGPASSLTSNPFSGLGAPPQESPRAISAPASPPEKPREERPQAGFRVERTKKGNYPVFLEKRAAGKTVTIVRNLSGATEALLALLRKHCAAGGKAFADSVEIQGDHCTKVETFLRGKGL
jgi:translation initiation factor 1 (eIF-1/SUI1)